MNVIDKLETWMKGAGFVDVELKVFKVRTLPEDPRPSPFNLGGPYVNWWNHNRCHGAPGPKTRI